MALNRGKKFEEIIKTAFEAVPDTSVVRIHDQTTGYLGSSNHCDFIVYHKPYEYHIECKSVHGNRLPFVNITDNQWKGLLEKSKIDGVVAGIICWWIDKDVTAFIPIQQLYSLKCDGVKSLKYDNLDIMTLISGKKRRIFFNYYMDKFFEEVII